jgi:effector-binding domain-containing protein
MRFEFIYHEYRFGLKYCDTFFTYDIQFSLSCRNPNHIFLSNIVIFCPFNNRFTFHYPSKPVYYNDLIKGIKENQKEFDLYIKSIKFKVTPFFTGV